MRADAEKNMGRRTEHLEKGGARFAFSINTNRFFFLKKIKLGFPLRSILEVVHFSSPKKNLKNKTLKGRNLEKTLDCHRKFTLNKSNEGRRCSS